jgi:hypothetical protein
MKVSLLGCMCWALVSTQLAGCGDPQDSSAEDLAASGETPKPNGFGGAPAEELPRATDADELGRAEAERETLTECPELDDPPPSCGQISIKLAGRGSSCQLAPTASDLSRPPRSVRFDCKQIGRGPDGYDFDSIGHVTLMGDTCQALHTEGPHRVTLVLTCEPGSSER